MDAALCEAAGGARRGLIDADLGGGARRRQPAGGPGGRDASFTLRAMTEKLGNDPSGQPDKPVGQGRKSNEMRLCHLDGM